MDRAPRSRAARPFTMARPAMALIASLWSLCALAAAPGAGYTVGGTISGLDAPGLVLASGAQTLSVASGATSFTFPGALADGSAYAVVVTDSPAGLDCNVAANGFGRIAGANITTVAIACVANAPGNDVLYSFAAGSAAPLDGRNPRAALIQARDGHFYGTTFAGGEAGLGTLFRLTLSGRETVLYSFAGQSKSDGANPTAALIQASDGNFYGATLIGGKANTGTIFRFTPAGKYTLLHAFEHTGSGGNFGGISRLVEGRDGALYCATILGGRNGTGTILRIARTGKVEIIYEFGPMHSGDGGNPQGPLLQARDGYLYGTTVQGGANQTGTVYRIDPTTGSYATVYSFGPAGSGDGAGPYSGLLETQAGRFYGMTGSGGSANQGAVFQVLTGANTGTTESVVYSFQGLGSGDGRVPVGELILGRDGFLYGTTAIGGANGVGVLFRLNTAGVESVVHAFGGLLQQDGAVPGGGPIQGEDGALYGTTSNGGSSNQGTVYRILP